MESWTQGHGMDDHWVVSIKVEDAELQQRPVGGWSDEHGQVLFHVDPAHRVANAVQDVLVGHTVLPRRLADSHADNISCLRGRVKK